MKKPYSAIVTRSTFERKLGGVWETDPNRPGWRTNGSLETYKDASEKEQERRACFLRTEKGKRYEARTWALLLRLISDRKVQNGNQG